MSKGEMDRDNPQRFPLDANPTSIEIDDLHVWTNYSVQVTGLTVLEGPASNVMSAFTAEDGMCY